MAARLGNRPTACLSRFCEERSERRLFGDVDAEQQAWVCAIELPPTEHLEDVPIDPHDDVLIHQLWTHRASVRPLIGSVAAIGPPDSRQDPPWCHGRWWWRPAWPVGSRSAVG
jgi:hypothetical protein